MARAEVLGNDTLPPGTVLGRYELGRQLGRGGMGAVYEATHRDLKKRVAVKVLSSALHANQEAQVRFLREGEAASRIRHPHVVDVTDVGSDGNVTYLVMEFLEGEDLASLLNRAGPLPPQAVADIMLPVCSGVAAAHDEGVIHRDLKPENIFLAKPRHGGTQPKVLDFGVSKVVGDRGTMALTGTAATFGTPYYMPPEQLRGARQADQKSDQYALGVVIYECLTGRRPFEADNIYAMLRAIGDGEYPPPRALRPQISEAFEMVIVRAMQLDPAGRFPTVRHLGAALLAFASDTGRLTWTDTFRVRSESEPNTIPAGVGSGLPVGSGSSPAPTSSLSAPKIRSQPSGPGSVSGTQKLPPPAQPAPSLGPKTTLGSATGQQLASFERPRSRRGLFLGLLVLGAGAAAAGVFFLRPGTIAPRSEVTESTTTREKPRSAGKIEIAPAPPFRVDITAEPSAATLELDGAPVGVGTLERVLPRDGQEHRLVARAAGYRDAVIRFTDEPPPRFVTLAPIPEEQPAQPTAATDAPADLGARGKPPRFIPRPRRHKRGLGGPGATPQQPGEAPPPTTANGAPVID